MIILKTDREIKILREGGRILAETLNLLKERALPGVSFSQLEKIAVDYIQSKNAICAFKGYKPSNTTEPFPSCLCLSVNEAVVHGPANKNTILKEGDILGIDLGVQYKGLYTDSAITIPIGKISDKNQRLLQTTEKALYKGIEQVKPGNYIHNISQAIQECVEKEGFSVVREFVGHGVGKYIHEDPPIPNFVNNNQPIIKLKKGMVIAIEPMVNIGDYLVETADDGWTVITKDRSNSAHFEHTVAVVEGGYQILTKI